MSRLPRILLVALFAFALPLVGFAQQEGSIEGTIQDSEQEDPLPGVQVVLPEFNKGTVTGAEGTYTITGVPAGSHEIEARFVGYRTARKTVEVQAGETTTVDFTLRPSTVDLDEVVVTGAGGPVEKRKLGNQISTINTQGLENAPIENLSDLIQGREPGVVGLPSGGLTGEGSRIRIRGSASLSQSNEPLVYIDGVRMNNGGGFGGGYVGTGGGGSPSRLDDLDPQIIERVEILKGASAATLFGTEASNGVIQVFTKSGTTGPPEFTFKTEQTAIRYPSDAYPDQVGFAQTQAQAERMGRILRDDPNAFQPYELVHENFPNSLLGTGFAQKYSGTISGGGETALGSTSYYISGRFLSEDGPFEGNPEIMPKGASTRSNDAIQRAQGSAKLEVVPNDDLRLRLTSGYYDTSFETLQTNNNIYGTISLAQFSKPELIFVDENRANRTGTIAFATVAESVQQTTTQDTRHFNGSFQANWQITDAFSYDGVFGVDFTNNHSEFYRPFGWNVDNFATDTPEGEKEFTVQNTVELTIDQKLKHTTDIGERFESDLTVGFQGFLTRSNMESAQGQDFPGPGFRIVQAAANQSVLDGFSEVVNAGVFAQEQFGFNDFVFLTVGARYDANSAFGEDFNGVLYPKASASVIPSDAPFWNEPLGPISSLRFRAAIGQSGLQPGAFDALTTFGPLTSPSGPGIVPDNLGNPNLKPEISTEWEVGTEVGLFEDRASLEANYWNRTVNDALVSRQFPPSGGFQSPQLSNVGSIDAQGVELSTNVVVFDRDDFSLDVNANASYLWEQVTDLGGAPPIKVGGSYPRYRNYIVEGYAPGSHFGVQLKDVSEGHLPVDFNGDGNPDTEDQVRTYLAGLTPSTASLPSNTQEVLIGTNPDSPTGLETDFYLGKPTPDWQGSVGFNARFLENFELSTLFEYKTGNYHVNNLTDAFRQSNAFIGRNLPSSARVERNYLTGGVDESGNPKNDPDVRLQALKKWLNENLALAPFSGLNTIKQADFVRWREVSLTYNLPESVVQRVGGRRLSLSVSGRNLALWTKYDGVDPELNAVGRGSGSQLDQNFLKGVEAFGFPIPRRFQFSLRFGF